MSYSSSSSSDNSVSRSSGYSLSRSAGSYSDYSSSDTIMSPEKAETNGILNDNDKKGSGKAGKGKSRGKGKGKVRGKGKSNTKISFDGIVNICSFCNKEFAGLPALEKHIAGETKCGLKTKIQKLELDLNSKPTENDIVAKLETEIEEYRGRVAILIEQRDSHANNITKNDTGDIGILGIPDDKADKLKKLLVDFKWPTKPINDVMRHKYQTLYRKNKQDDVFVHWFNTFMSNNATEKVSQKSPRMGIFITNSHNQYGLLIKNKDKLMLDTSGIIAFFLQEFYFKNEKVFDKKLNSGIEHSRRMKKSRTQKSKNLKKQKS